MDVGLSLFRGLDLDDQVDVGDVKTTRSNISCDKNSEFALLEALHCDFTLVLGDITVHDLNVLLDLVRQEERVGVGLSLSKDDDLATFAVDDEDVGEGGQTVLEGALDSQMGHIASSLVLKLHGEINNAHALLHVSRCHISHPSWNGGREQKNL